VRGASATEYTLVLTLVAIAALAAWGALGESVHDEVTCVAGAISGGAPGHCGPSAAATPAATEGTTWLFTPPPVFGAYHAARAQAFVAGGGDSSAVHPSDIDQGAAGDCYLMASMAAIATRDPAAMERIVRPIGDGRYEVTLHRGSGPSGDREGAVPKAVDIVVGDATFPGFTAVNDAQALNAQPGDRTRQATEVWPMLVEKAYAKLYGGYTAIGDGGYVDNALEALTGRASRTVIHDETGFDFESIARAWQEGSAIVMTTYGDEQDDELFGDGTFVADHAYYVSDVDPENRTITVRNPWGWDEPTYTLSWDLVERVFTQYDTNPIQ